jgi:hypothetical protein
MASRLVKKSPALAQALKPKRVSRYAQPSAIAQALKPTFVDGCWRKPKLSARNAAKLRKQAIVDGTFGSFSPEKGKYFIFDTRFEYYCSGGWDPMWDKPQRAVIMRPPKGHKYDNNKDER